MSGTVKTGLLVAGTPKARLPVVQAHKAIALKGYKSLSLISYSVLIIRVCDGGGEVTV